MKKIVLASNNKHKITEISQILNNQEIITMEQIGFDKEIIEDGTTFLENALIKAKTISEFIKDKGLDYDVLSDDSGLCCEALDGKPGIYSARYSENHNDKANRDKLIKDLEGKDKTAYFNCTMVLYHIDGTYEHVDGKTYGKIIDHEVGDTSFGYDCIFLSEDLNKTFGSATSEEKNSVSHRFRAASQLKEYLREKDMKIIGIVARSYWNKDNQSILQFYEKVRTAFSRYDNVALIGIMPTDERTYTEITRGDDKLDNAKLNCVLDKCDGFIVPGGTYHQNLDEYVINHAIKSDKPLLGICLGFQIMCSMFSKERERYDMTIALPNNDHYKPNIKNAHKIKIKENTLLKSILKEKEINVNSVHHSYINNELKDLVISSYSEDGVIESVEYPNKKFIVGLQWHPEVIMNKDSIKILDYFVDKM